MQILIEIPESEIPKKQNIIEIPIHFIDGKVCEAGGYGFEVLPKGGRMIIIDMEMPKTCNECPCSYFTEGASSDYCQIEHQDFDKETEHKTYYGMPNGVYTRQKWCPLKESEEKYDEKKLIPIHVEGDDKIIGYMEQEVAKDLFEDVKKSISFEINAK